LVKFVIVNIGPPSCYVKVQKDEPSSMGVTFQRSQAREFDTQMEAEMEVLRLRLPQTWFVVER
jgi:hypothetical protein